MRVGHSGVKSPASGGRAIEGERKFNRRTTKDRLNILKCTKL